MEEYLLLGYIAGSFGLDGTVKVISKTQFAKKRYAKGNRVFLTLPNSTETKELTVTKYRSNGQFDFVKFEEINTKEEADTLKSSSLKVIKDRNDIGKDMYFFSDLVGCNVIDENHNVLGVVKEVEEFPAQLTLRVKGEKDFFVPFVKAFIRNVSIENKEIEINVIEGML